MNLVEYKYRDHRKTHIRVNNSEWVELEPDEISTDELMDELGRRLREGGISKITLTIREKDENE